MWSYEYDDGTWAAKYDGAPAYCYSNTTGWLRPQVVPIPTSVGKTFFGTFELVSCSCCLTRDSKLSFSVNTPTTTTTSVSPPRTTTIGERSSSRSAANGKKKMKGRGSSPTPQHKGPQKQNSPFSGGTKGKKEARAGRDHFQKTTG